MHLTTLLRIQPADLPQVAAGTGDARTVRFFPERLPIGIHSAGRGVVVYVIADPWLDEFQVFLIRHAALLHALPAWTVRIVVPPQFAELGQRAKQTVWNQLMSPLGTQILDETRWYFEQARTHSAPSRCPELDERFYKARRAFSTPRFKALHRVWKETGEAAFASCTSDALDNAVKVGAGRVETLELGHRYGHLSPWLPLPDADADVLRPCASRRTRRRLLLHLRPSRPTLGLEHRMTQKVDAIYTGGVLKPTRELPLKDKQRVRLTVETIDEPVRDREAAIARLEAGIASMRFFSEGPLPSREELHDRR